MYHLTLEAQYQMCSYIAGIIVYSVCHFASGMLFESIKLSVTCLLLAVDLFSPLFHSSSIELFNICPRNVSGL